MRFEHENENVWQDQLSQLSKRDLFLWLFGGGVLFLVCAGLLALVVPNIISRQNEVWVDPKHLPQLLGGLLCLLALFAIYVNGQRRQLSQARDAVYRRCFSDQQRAEGLMDPQTQTYSPVLLHTFLERMTNEATEESPFSVLDIQIDDLDMTRRQNGEAAVEHLVRSLAELLRSSLRGSDRICRVGEGNFVVLLPDTSSENATVPVRRILQGVDRWNKATALLDYDLGVHIGTTTSTGTQRVAVEVLDWAREMRRHQPILHPAGAA